MSQDSLLNSDKNSHLSPTVKARLQKCYEFGNQKMQAGEYDYACEMFTQCLVGSPGNLIYLQSFVANLRLKYGNNKKGAAFAKLKGGGARSQLKLSQTRSKWEDVLKAGAELLKLNPWDSGTFFAMGKATLALGYDDTGLAYIKHAVECNPTDVEMNRFAADELANRELYDDAIACLQRIIDATKDNDMDASHKLKDMLLQKTMKHMEKRKIDAQTASESAEGKISEEDQFEKKISKNPEDHDLWVEYIDYFNRSVNLRKLEDTLRRALKQFPEDENFQFRLTEVRRDRTKNEMAQLRERYQKTPDDATKKKFMAARKTFEELTLSLIQQKLKKNPNSTEAHSEYGFFLMNHGKFNEAISELQKAQQDETLKSDCFLAIAQCFEQIKQYKLALTHYEKAIAVFQAGGNAVLSTESSKKAFYLAARLAAGLGDYKKAEILASKLAEIDFSYKDVGVLLDKIAKRLQN